MPSPGRPKSSQTLRAATSGDIQPRRNTRSSGPTRFPFTQSRPLSRDQEDAFSSPAVLSKSHGKRPRVSEPAFHNHSESQFHLSNADDRRGSVGPSFAMSTMSTMPTQASIYHDKQSGFRATIRRMFGSRAHRHTTQHSSSEINYSDPGNLMSINTSRTDSFPSPQNRRPSQPLTRPSTQGVTLRSHAPAASLQGLSSSTHAGHSPQKRRNTLPSLALTDAEDTSFTLPLTAAVNKTGLEHNVVASGWTDKRRSRSLEALTNTPDPPLRNPARLDRESEIAYWRQSVLVDPVPSLHVSSLVDDTETPPDSPQLSRHTPAAVKPVQSFDFGLNVGDDSTTLEERVNTLEVKMFDFEYAIAKLQGNELAKPVLQPVVSRSKSSHDLYLRQSSLSMSTESSARRMMSFSRPRPVNMLTATSPEADAADHTSGSNTVRPRTSQGIASERPMSSSSVRITRSEYEALMTIISDEKEARQQMEMQIMHLQKEVQQLQAPVFAAINYPTPELENGYDMPPPRIKTLHRTNHFDFAPAARSQSRFSVDSDAEFQSDDFEHTYKIPSEDTLGLNLTNRSQMIGVSVI